MGGVWFLVQTIDGGTPTLTDGNVLRHYLQGHGSHAGMLEEDFRGVSVSTNVLAIDIATDGLGNAYILYSDIGTSATTLAKIDLEHKQVQWSIPVGPVAASSGGVAIDALNNVLFTYVTDSSGGAGQFVLMDENQHILWSVERGGTPNGCCIGVDTNASPWVPTYLISYWVRAGSVTTTTIEMLDVHGTSIWTFTGDPTTMRGSSVGCLDCDTLGNVFAGFGTGTFPGNIVVLDPHNGALVGNYDAELLPGPFLASVGNNWQVTEDGVAISANSTGLNGPEPDPADPGNPSSNFRVPSVVAAQNSALKYNVVAMPGENWPGESIGWEGTVKHAWRVPNGGSFNGHGQWVFKPETYGLPNDFEGWLELPEGAGLAIVGGLPGGRAAWVAPNGLYLGPQGPPVGGYEYPGLLGPLDGGWAWIGS